MKLALALLLAVLASLAALSAPGSATAQQPIEATVEVIGGADAPLTVGDPIVIRVEVRHPDDAWVEIDSSMTTLSPLDAALQELELSEPGRTVVTWRTAAFTVGVFDITLPPITVVSGGTRQLLTFEPQRIVIASVLTEDIIGPRPLTPPGVIEGGANFAPWIGALVAIGVGFVIARALRMRTLRRRAPQLAQAPAPLPRATIPDVSDDANADDVCRGLALAVREHLAAQYGIPARSLTSAELPEHLAAAGAPAATVQRVRTLLRVCDAVTFADQPAVQQRLAGYRELAVAIVESPSEAH